MSVMGLPGGCSATRLGRMKGADVEGLASARSARSVGCVMTKRRRRASSASRRSVNLSSFWPMASMAAQRRIEATQSSAVTGWPSCHVKPTRKVSV